MLIKVISKWKNMGKGVDDLSALFIANAAKSFCQNMKVYKF